MTLLSAAAEPLGDEADWIGRFVLDGAIRCGGQRAFDLDATGVHVRQPARDGASSCVPAASKYVKNQTT